MTTPTFTPGPTPNTVRAADGQVLTAPGGWVLLPPGDAALTRRVKSAGEHWVVAEKKGRKVFSRGVWASAATIERIRAELTAERATEGFAKRKEAGRLCIRDPLTRMQNRKCGRDNYQSSPKRLHSLKSPVLVRKNKK